jgi:long-chain acyl-CoA synthetase
VEKLWLAQYGPGIPHEIRWDEHASLGELFDACAVRFAGRDAYYCMGRTMSFAELARRSAWFGAWLQSTGLEKGARVAIMLPNILQYPVAMFGVLRAGYTVVNTNPQYTPRELEHQLTDSGAEAIIVLENFADTLQQVLARTRVRHVVLATIGDLLGWRGPLTNFVVRHVKRMVPPFSLPSAVPFNTVLARGATASMRPSGCTHDDIAFLQYTGGTTGVAKGAMLTHRNILANLEQVRAWMEGPLLANQRPVRIVTPLPLYHIFSLTSNCLAFMKMGGCNILVPNPRDIPGFVRLLGRVSWHGMTGVNTLFNALLASPDFARLDFSQVLPVVAGGMALQEAVARRWLEVTGKPLSEGYGMTETSPVVCSNPLGRPKLGTVGLPVPSTEISIRDDAGQELGQGQPGELCVRGPQVMKGYWQRPDETAKVLGADGFIATGDIAVVDPEGYVKIVDRKKDMISVSGFKVFPNEVEDVVAQLPGVLEVAAVGIPDKHSGEAVELFIVRRDPSLTEEEVRAHCEKYLTGYKRPRRIEFRRELPKSNVGKILRRALRDEVLAAQPG